MKRNIPLVAGVTMFAGLGSLVIVAQTPNVNIGNRHGNLRAAQQSIVQAYQQIEAAQNANNYNLGGHADRAKVLLRQADEELRLAADSANHNGR